MFDNWSPTEKLIAAFLGLLLVVGLAESAPVILLLILIFGGLYGFQRVNQSQSDYNEEEDVIIRRNSPVRQERSASNEQIYQHALKAVRRAGLDPNGILVLPVDIGMIAFHQNDTDGEPMVYHTHPIANTSDYVQPFIELRLPKAVNGSIRFEILDSYGSTVFVHEDQYELQRGRNLISPAARLPVHDELYLENRWELRVSTGDTVLARHVFTWGDEIPRDDPGRLAPEVGEDGEISTELRAILKESRLPEMSLDDLLAYQEDDQQRTNH